VPPAGVRNIQEKKMAAMRAHALGTLLGNGAETAGENSSSMLAGTRTAVAACDGVAAAAADNTSVAAEVEAVAGNFADNTNRGSAEGY
jgi:hypothetical protein